MEITESQTTKPTYNRAQLAKENISGRAFPKQYNHKGYLQTELRRKILTTPFPPIAHY
ncbi:MAG: hypothetical protein IPL33_20385, partial [Sphingobacteriales bacterium]|nr:hypothetical protein [Sphingobacteriales bacterium]